MDERPPADRTAGARRWAAWLGIAAGLAPPVEQVVVRLRFDAGAGPGLGEPLWVTAVSLALLFVMVSGVPVAGAAMVLAGRQRVVTGLLVLVVFGVLQLPNFIGQAWHILAFAMPPWFWSGHLLAVAAGAAAVVALGATAFEVGPLRYDGGRGVAAAGVLALAAADLVPSVVAVGEAGTMLVAGGGGLSPLAAPFSMFTILALLRPLTLVAVAAGVVALRRHEALLVLAGVCALFAVVGLLHLLVSLASPLWPDLDGAALRPAAALDVAAAGLLVTGVVVLWREVRT